MLLNCKIQNILTPAEIVRFLAYLIHKKIDLQQDTRTEIFPLSQVGKKTVDLRFTGQDLSSDAGALLLSETDQQIGLIDKLADCIRDDALLTALASLTNVDVLVSWNFRHIVHYDKIRFFNAVNIENGLKSIDIYSPREVTNYEE